jgi:hypothetical protein
MIKRLLVILTLLASSLGASFAQEYRGTVQGLVTDSSQAVIPAAKMTLVNVNTGVSVTKQSNSLGVYRFDFVEPGIYTVAAEASGFAKSIRENVAVDAHGNITLDFTLNPGRQNQSVTVTAESGAVALQFNSTSKELTVTHTELTELPFEYRSPITAVLLDPAVVNVYPDKPYPYYMWQMTEMDFGGQTSRENDVLIDGSSATIGPKGSYMPVVDDVQELVVDQMAVDSEQGHSAGGVTNMVTRAGTNAFHGTASYYGINPSLNAVTNVFTRTPSVSRSNIWGAAGGGPIKKNKLFTFGAYEGRLVSSPNTTVMTLPTAAERNGDYSQSLNISGDLRTIYNPYTTVFDPVAGTQTRTPFTGNIIPSNMIDPTAAKIMSYIWKPNTTPSNIAGANNFMSTVGINTHYYNFSDRTDWNVSDKLKVFGRYAQFHTILALGDYTGMDSPAESDGMSGSMNSKNLGGNAVYTINPTTVAEVRFGYTSFIDNAGVPQNIIGTKGLASLWPSSAWYQPYLSQYGSTIYFPTITIGSNNFGVPYLWIQQPHSYTWAGKLVKSRGRHDLKAGLEARYQGAFISYPGNLAFNFTAPTTSSSSITAPTKVSGDPYATFLLGAPDNGSSSGFAAPGQFSSYYYGAYVQDDLKLSRRITLNLGLRYEYESTPVDSKNQYSRLDLNGTNPTLQGNPPPYTSDVIALRSQYLGASAATPPPNGEWVFNTPSQRGQFDAPGVNFAPRAGIAFRLNDKTALRAGYGRFLILNSQVQNGYIANPAFVGYSTNSTVLPSLNGVPTTALSNPYPSNNSLQLPVGSAGGVNTNLGNGYGDDWGDGLRDPNYKDGALNRYNLTVERELPGKFRLEISYLETDGKHMDSSAFWDSFPENEANPNLYYTLQGNSLVQYPNPFYNYMTPAQFPGGLRNQPTVTLWQLLRPYPQYTNLYESHVPVEGDITRNIEFRVQRTYANGFSLLGSYIYSHEQLTIWPDGDMTDGPYYYNHTPVWSEGFYSRHRMITSTLYALPVGRGKKNLAHMNPVLDGVLGGWSASSIISITSGKPLRMGGSYIMTGNPAQNVPAGYGFNPGAFALLPAYTPQTAPQIFPGVDGPVQWNIDAQLSKSFRLREGIDLHFRMEAYNLTNSVVWASEDTGYGDSTFGQKNLAQSNIGRTLQYSLRLTF